MRSLRRSLLLSCWKKDSKHAVRIFEIIDMVKKASVKVRRLRWPTKADVFFVMADEENGCRTCIGIHSTIADQSQRNGTQVICL